MSHGNYRVGHWQNQGTVYTTPGASAGRKGVEVAYEVFNEKTGEVYERIRSGTFRDEAASGWFDQSPSNRPMARSADRTADLTARSRARGHTRHGCDPIAVRRITRPVEACHWEVRPAPTDVPTMSITELRSQVEQRRSVPAHGTRELLANIRAQYPGQEVYIRTLRTTKPGEYRVVLNVGGGVLKQRVYQAPASGNAHASFVRDLITGRL